MKYILVFIILLSGLLNAQIIVPSSDSSRGATVGYSVSSSSIVNNPSFLTFLKDDFLGFGYVRYYNPSFFYSFNIGYGKKLNVDGGAAFLWQRYNSSENVEFFDYQENQFNIAYGHILFDFLRPGACLKILNIDTDSGSAMGYGLSLSFLVIPADNYYLSVILDRVLSSQLKWSTNLKEEMERGLFVGVGYKVKLWKIQTIFSADYMVNNVKINDYVISDDPGYDDIKSGLTFNYGFLDLSIGFIKNDQWNITSGLGVSIMENGKTGINFINNGNELGYTTGFYFEYAN
ncbi:MAG: hypothetical protein JW827_08520 [Spirochaetes bacterium]|nr:hypothetical protein [Spirochaetota bacterium]